MKSGCIFLLAMILVGCSSPANPSFPLTSREAGQVLKQMKREPKSLERPLVVIGGYKDPGFACAHLVGEFKRLTGDSRVIGVSPGFSSSFANCRKAVIRKVDRAFPSDDPIWTTEVDVLAVSMGGVVARYAAMEDENDPNARRLRIARLFTISSPHQGARMAAFPTWNRLHRDLRHGSPFLMSLNDPAVEVDYPIYPYVRLGDQMVGAHNAAPPGQGVWWVANRPGEDAHMVATRDPRIKADIARRLRGEEPFTRSPPEPLPNK